MLEISGFFAPGAGPARTWQDHALVVPRAPARRLAVFTPLYRGFKVPGTLLENEPELDEEYLVRATIALAGGMSAIAHVAREPLRWQELVEIGLADAYAEGAFAPAPGIDPFDPDAIADRKLRNTLRAFAGAATPYWHGFETAIATAPYHLPLVRRVNQEVYESRQAGEDTPALQARITRLLEAG